jgi:signal transduction histidine kinase/DNA-binding NarL/FixJ family response regulator
MSASETDSSRQAFTVLVADDSLPDRNLIKTMFQQRGHRVLEAADGAESLLLLAAERPDVVVLDGVMPTLDGYQLCRLLKDDPSTRHMPVILLTGQAGGLSRFWARICGADRFLLKGREATRVVDAAAELLAGAPGAPALGEATKLDLPALGPDAIHQRLGKALEHRLLESALRDTIGHMYSLQQDAVGMAGAVLELLHELVLPGAIHLAVRGENGPVGLGLYGTSMESAGRAAMEKAARQALGQEDPWPSTWTQRPSLIEKAAVELHDPAIFSLPVGLPGGPNSAWMTLYMERRAFREYARLFEIACLELARLLDLAESHRQVSEAEAALLQAQKMESIALMAGGVAHDFNNLFQSILGSLELAALSPTDERGKTALARALTAVERGADMGRRLLETSGHLWCVTAPLDLNSLVREVLAARPELAFTLELAGDLPLVKGDRNHLKNALAHILTNAVEAIGSGPGRITVSTRLSKGEPREDHTEGQWFTEHPTGRTVAITLADTGCGATEEVVSRMFDPFFSTKLFGRGMSLAATQGILKAHHAALYVESRVGEGTTFHIWLPPA